VSLVSAEIEEAIEDQVGCSEDLKERAPIVTVMGHERRIIGKNIIARFIFRKKM